MLLRKLIVQAAEGDLPTPDGEPARKGLPYLPVNVADVLARRVASADPAQQRATRRLGARRQRQGPNG